VSEYEVRVLRPDDAEAYQVLRREALERAPLAFASSPADDHAASVDAVRTALASSDHGVTFGAFGPDLVGIVGIHRDRHEKAAHKAHVWGMYVTPPARRRGIARSLLFAAIEQARAEPGVDQVRLSVTNAAPEASRLYHSMGFEVWGTEPDALRHDGLRADEAHLVLHLQRAS